MTKLSKIQLLRIVRRVLGNSISINKIIQNSHYISYKETKKTIELYRMKNDQQQGAAILIIPKSKFNLIELGLKVSA